MTRKFVKRSIFFWLYCCLQVNLVFLCWRNDPKRMTGWKHTWQCYDLFSVDCITTPGRTDRQKVRNYFQILIRNFWCIKVLFSIKIFWNSCQMYAKLHSKCSLSYSLLEYGLLSLIFQDHGVTRGVSVRKSLLGKVVMRPGFFPTEPFADNNTSQTQLCHKKSNPGSPVHLLIFCKIWVILCNSEGILLIKIF